MKCPIDDSPLSVSSREGVEIDFCPQCRGVWLDRGELDKIIDRVSATLAATAPQPASAADFADARRSSDERGADRAYYDRGDDRERRKRKRRSFLEEIFDFD